MFKRDVDEIELVTAKNRSRRHSKNDDHSAAGDSKASVNHSNDSDGSVRPKRKTSARRHSSIVGSTSQKKDPLVKANLFSKLATQKTVQDRDSEDSEVKKGEAGGKSGKSLFNPTNLWAKLVRTNTRK